VAHRQVVRVIGENGSKTAGLGPPFSFNEVPWRRWDSNDVHEDWVPLSKFHSPTSNKVGYKPVKRDGHPDDYFCQEFLRARFCRSVLSGLSPRPWADESFLAFRQLEKFGGNIPSVPRDISPGQVFIWESSIRMTVLRNSPVNASPIWRRSPSFRFRN